MVQGLQILMFRGGFAQLVLAVVGTVTFDQGEVCKWGNEVEKEHELSFSMVGPHLTKRFRCRKIQTHTRR